jgi:DNA/RNA non-specific endonuclease
MAVIGATSSATKAQAAPPPQTPNDVAKVLLDRNTDKLGRVDTKAMVKDIKTVTSDAQTQRDIAAAAAKQMGNRSERQTFVKELKDEGVARKPGFFEQKWQEAKGTVVGVGKGVWSLGEGVVDLAKLSAKVTVAEVKFVYNYSTDAKYRDDTHKTVANAAKTAIDVTDKGLKAANDYVTSRIESPDKLSTDFKNVKKTVGAGADIVVAKADQLYDSYDKARSEAVIQGKESEFAGEIVGRVGFEVVSTVVPVSKIGWVAKGAKAADALGDANKLIKGAEVIADTGKIAKGAEVVVDAGKVAKVSEPVVEAGKVATATKTGTQTATKLNKGADEALARTGGDVAKVKQLEQEAKAAGEAVAEASKRPALLDGRAQVYIDDAGKKGNWNKTLNKTLKPEADYHYNGYKFSTDAKGRVTSVEGKLDLSVADRASYQQRKVGKSGDAGDEGGHLIASIFNGPGEKLNMTPMNGNFNKGAWKKLENKLAAAAKEGKTVEVKIEVVYGKDGVRADQFVATYKIDGGRPIKVEFDNVPGGKK